MNHFTDKVYNNYNFIYNRNSYDRIIELIYEQITSHNLSSFSFGLYTQDKLPNMLKSSRSTCLMVGYT